MNIFSLFTLCGGIAFFLYGMSLMSTRLEKLAGGRMEQLLKKMTSTPIKGLLLGAGITIAIQSSGAVTVMLVGLVNSGILELGQSIGTPPSTGTHAPYMHPATATEEQPVMPKTYMLWAILSLILCCLPAGIVAVIMSSRVSAKFYEGDYEGARRASRNAEIWIIISFVLGVLSNTLYLPFMFLIGR